MNRRQQGISLFLGILLLAIFLASSPPAGPGSPADRTYSAPAKPADEEIWVEVSGSVRNRGIYRLRKGATLLAAVEKAGGTAGRRILDPQSAARTLERSARIEVEERNGVLFAGLSPLEPGKMKTLSVPVDINTAGPEELDILPGVGPKLAQAIVDFRETRGKFSSLEDLMKVEGVGPKKIAALRPHLTISD